MTTRTNVAVLGGGIVGLCCALHLQKRGREVILIDRSEGVGRETSFGNAGLIQPDGMMPITFPRDLSALISYAANRRRDCYYRASALPDLAPALFQYWRQSHPDRMAVTLQGNIPLFRHSVPEHFALAEEAGALDMFRPIGWTRVFRREKTFDSHRQKLAVAALYGVAAEELSRAQLRALEPRLSPSVIGAIRFTGQLSLPSPVKLSEAYRELFVRRGGIVAQGDARTISANKNARWEVRTTTGLVDADEAVVSLGPWSGDTLGKLGYALPFFVKRGYHLHFTPQAGAELRNPISDVDGGYSLTPMENGIRLNTGVEFARRDDRLSSVQINRVLPWARDFFPIGEQVERQAWVGSRPCLPDMLPIIGPAPRHRGLWVATAHAHHGLTLAAATGRLIAEMMNGETPFIDPSFYRLNRF
ncbi:FAD-binding oxidoreductase [Rhizobium viscosum]|uniref:D-amino-acid dehydrogenase n=1 Tax=Rhizobium viscosum TaxID=1673 RepID=A0ABR9IYE1_RHIVS|nr:FAD-dependent oxidoreductase [Rhizobium viscosum]MBE1508220.1 D-amino-acid dehydrogenase [Rhizobium viscosum]